ncbi:SMP-30/gluconolactonase/LRE family protein (plasmid) [Sphingomonas sp. NY01]|uniref:SMP-30/gluconolactonase/LRE family protein n=1 Tax=Sphingomonas sp. NY01 TaxID=2968057 RepID=UPI00315CE8E6
MAEQGRRGFMAGVLAIAGLAATAGRAQTNGTARRWDGREEPVLIPDPDVIALDPAFEPLLVGNAVIERTWTGGDWLEGPAWSAQGQYLLFSDVRRDRQHRLLWENGAVSVRRAPSGFSNGNIFDHQGRQVSCQHGRRRVVRVEHDGSVRVLADAFEGQPFNSPNDLVSHPDGSIWFTDPPYGRMLAEGQPDAPGGPANHDGRFDGAVGTGFVAPLPPASARRPGGVYRWDPSGTVERVLDEGDLPMPNGLAFAPDHATLYVASTPAGPGTPPPPAGDKAIHAFPVQGRRLGRGRRFSAMTVEGAAYPPDGFRVDRAGNLWCASAGAAGHAGVLVLSPAGKPLGRIRLPEACANLTFGGPRRDTLFMCATRSIYRLQVNAQGHAPS